MFDRRRRRYLAAGSPAGQAPAPASTLLPLLAGVGLLSFNGKSFLGWLLATGGVAVILAGGVLMSLDIVFQLMKPVRDHRDVRPRLPGILVCSAKGLRPDGAG